MKPNVLLVVLDSVRARNTSLHGHVNDTTPFLRSFAEGATTYTNARAPTTWSLPSHVSMFTGHHVAEHGLVSRSQRLISGETVWETLSEEHGYDTAVFSSNPFLTAVPVGLERAFDTAIGRVDLPFEAAMDPREFVREHGTGQFGKFLREASKSEQPVRSLLNGLYEKVERDAPRLVPEAIRPNPTGQLFVDRFLDWEREQSGPWGVCLNLMDAHHPYEPKSEYDQWGRERLRELQSDISSYIWEFNGGHRPWWQRRALEGLYDGSIRQLDAIIKSLISTLEERGALENTLLVITADHGEGFGEQSTVRPGARAVGHGNGTSHETTLHVPLVAKYPGSGRARTVDDVCSLTYFPEMVNGAMRDEPERFESTGPVVATCSGLNDRTRRNASEYCDDLTLFEGDTNVYYEDAGTETRKYASWHESGVTIVIRNSQTSYRVSDSGRERVTDVFNDLSNASVTEATDDVDDAVTRRLEDLGYA